MALGIWGAAVAAGFGGLQLKSTLKCAIAAPSSAPPELLATGPEPFTLVVAVHPRCPCTLASLENLEQLMARCAGRLACRVLMYQPATPSEAWTRGPTWDAVSRIPGVTIDIDTEGRAAVRLGELTSGSAVLFDVHGVPRYAGGLTLARGHAGENPATDAIAQIVLSPKSEQGALSLAPVFGCPLTEPCPTPTDRAPPDPPPP